MKKFLFLTLVVLICISPVFVSCGKSGTNQNRKFTKPEDTQYNNVFSYYDSFGGSNAYFYANRVEVSQDFSAKITYSFSKKIERTDVEKAFEQLNKKIYTIGQYSAGNRLFYVEKFIYEETEQTELIGVEVFCADLNYACTNNYKSYTLEDFNKTNVTSSEVYGNPIYGYFKNASGEKENTKSKAYVDNQQNYKVLAFDGYNSTKEVVYKIDGKIIAYYIEKSESVKIDEAKNEMTVKLNNSTGYKFYIFYEIEKRPDTIWWIVGGAMVLVAAFGVILTIRLIQTKKNQKGG